MKQIRQKILERLDAHGVDGMRLFCAVPLLLILAVLSLAYCIAGHIWGLTVPASAMLGYAVVCIVLAITAYCATKIRPAFPIVLGAATLALIALCVLFSDEEATFTWVCIMPAFAPFVFGLRWGLVLDAACLAELIIFNLVPFSDTGRPTAPLIIVFAAVAFISLFFEYVFSAKSDSLAKLLAAEREAARTDALTGVKNRWWYSKQLEAKNEQPEYRRRYAIILIDIDEFKSYNDTYGHLFGDDILIRCADVITQCVCKGDIVCRWGGDEFLCQVRAAGEADALTAARRIYDGVHALDIAAPDGSTISIGVSIGVIHVANPGKVFSTELFALADKALYAAKSADGERIKVFSDFDN